MRGIVFFLLALARIVEVVTHGTSFVSSFIWSATEVAQRPYETKPTDEDSPGRAGSRPMNVRTQSP